MFVYYIATWQSHYGFLLWGMDSVWLFTLKLKKEQFSPWTESNDNDQSKVPVVSLSKKPYPHCLVLVMSRNKLERDITIELNYIDNLIIIEDWLKCHKAPSVQNMASGANFTFSDINNPFKSESPLYRTWPVVRNQICPI